MVSKESRSASPFSAGDVVIVLGFLLFSALFQLSHIGDQPPYVLLDGDAGNIATFAAARDHPESFAGDEILQNERLSRWYPTIHVPVVRALSRWTGEYGLAFQGLLGLHVFLQALGFYILGRVLFHSRYWALLLACVTLVRVDLNLGELWGVYSYPIPRISFQSVLPFVAGAAYHWRANPRVWPAIMIAAGLLIYVHPVSAPSWGLAFWLGFIPFLSLRSDWKRSLGMMLGLGALFLLVTAPFLMHYVSEQDMGGAEAAVPYQRVYEIIEARFLPGYLDIPRAFVDFLFAFTTIRGKKFFWVWAAIGGLVVLVLRRRCLKSVLPIYLWMSAIAITSLFLPIVDQAVAKARNTFPIEYDLVRGIRYLVPFMLLFCLWPLAEVGRLRRQGRASRALATAAGAAGALLVSMWIYWHPPLSPSYLVRCWREGHLACDPPNLAQTEALEAIKRLTPNGSPILPVELPLQIRYFALRPVVHCHKDGGILAYTDHRELLKWDDRRQAMSNALALQDPRARMDGLVGLASGLGARYLLVESDWVNADGAVHYDVIWHNEDYALVETKSVEQERSPELGGENGQRP